MRILKAGFAILLLAGAGAAAGFFWFNQALHAPGPGGPEREITVPAGASGKRVARMLVEEGFVSNPWALRIWLRIHPTVPTPKAGRHKINPNLPFPDLFTALAQNPLPEDVPVTLVEGWRLSDADAFLAAKNLIEPGDYIRAASTTEGYSIPFPVKGPTLAGYLLPETYKVPPGKIDTRALVQRQLNAFDLRFYQPYKDEIKKSGRSLRTLVILASLLEREEPKPKVRPMVAGVLYNRLRKKNPLGVDATSRYTLKDWSDRRAFLKKLRDPNDPWNTRLRAGLPPGPIGAPSLPSLLAALRPKRSRYWYYLHDKDQKIHFSRTAAEHEAKRRKYNVW